MEHERVVVRRPHSFAEESKKRGKEYYDYENYVNIAPWYCGYDAAMAPTMSASARSDGASTARCSSRSTCTTRSAAWSRC